MNERLLSLLGLARRAGKLSMGFDASAEAMRRGEAALLLLSDDLSERTNKSIRSVAEQYNISVVCCGCGMDAMGHAAGRKKTGIITVCDNGFAEKMKALCAENSQEEFI